MTVRRDIGVTKRADDKQTLQEQVCLQHDQKLPRVDEPRLFDPRTNSGQRVNLLPRH